MGTMTKWTEEDLLKMIQIRKAQQELKDKHEGEDLTHTECPIMEIVDRVEKIEKSLENFAKAHNYLVDHVCETLSYINQFANESDLLKTFQEAYEAKKNAKRGKTIGKTKKTK